MIKRYYTLCKTCKTHHTLRITLGTDNYQEHKFNCTNCAEEICVSIEIDFNKRLSIGGLPKHMRFTEPYSNFKPLSNCEIAFQEGIIINLDPNFLISEELLHQDNIFPWMIEARKLEAFENLENKLLPAPFVNDVFDALGGVRNLKNKIIAVKKALKLKNKGQEKLAHQAIEEFNPTLAQ
ncbi:MAG TPA: hypothetical protein DIV86_06930, partial [Alphaproteobacteria bacterium]|nr:hypothetical protein [Alphaproteobacteria bacterium]